MRLVKKLVRDMYPSDAQAARVAGVTPPVLCEVMSGAKTPGPDSVVLKRIATGLGFKGEPAELLAEVDEATECEAARCGPAD